jgi:ppGpp synthetase/RelA/SpoT-type nucleotidyltranferase
MSISNIESWYTSNAPRYKDLEDKVTIIIKEMLHAENIQCQIESRVKELNRLEEKILKKGYKDIRQV